MSTATQQDQARPLQAAAAYVAVTLAALVPGLSVVVAVVLAATLLHRNRVARVALVVFGVLLLVLALGAVLPGGWQETWVGPRGVVG